MRQPPHPLSGPGSATPSGNSNPAAHHHDCNCGHDHGALHHAPGPERHAHNDRAQDAEWLDLPATREILAALEAAQQALPAIGLPRLGVPRLVGVLSAQIASPGTALDPALLALALTPFGEKINHLPQGALHPVMQQIEALYNLMLDLDEEAALALPAGIDLRSWAEGFSLGARFTEPLWEEACGDEFVPHPDTGDEQPLLQHARGHINILAAATASRETLADSLAELCEIAAALRDNDAQEEPQLSEEVEELLQQLLEQAYSDPAAARRRHADALEQSLAKLGGPAFQEQHPTGVWELPEAHDYLALLAHYSLSFWESEPGPQRDADLAQVELLMRLDPEDHFMVRHSIALWYLAAGRLDQTAEFLRKFPEDHSLETLTVWTMLAFAQTGDSPEARQQRKLLHQANAHLIGMLCGARPILSRMHDEFLTGSPQEGSMVAQMMRPTALDLAGFLPWLRKQLAPKRGK